MGAAALAAGLAIFWWWHARAVPIQAIIVRPFTGQGTLVEGLRQEMIGELARAPGPRVVSVPAEQPAVTGVLDVMAERSGDRIRVTAQLDRAGGGRYWRRTFDRPIADLPSIPAEIAAAVNPRVHKRGPRHRALLAAYEPYLEGRYDFYQPDNGGLERAIARFEDATQRDPDFALAWAWLSIARQYLADRGATRPNLALPEARDAADRAAALDPGLAEAHLALGIDYLQYDWQWSQAKSELDRALQLSPGSAMATYWRERWDAAMGRGPAPDFHFANLPPIRDAADARKLLEDADDIRVETYISPAALALVASSIHDTEGALHWLDVAYQEHCVQLPYLIWNPALPRSDPRFADLLRRMGLASGA